MEYEENDLHLSADWWRSRTAISFAVGGLIIVTIFAMISDADPSPECLDDMQVAAAEPDSSAAEPLIARTLSSCETADQWLDALREYPAAMGLKDSSFVDPDVELDVVCHSYTSTPVCRSR